MNTQSEQAAPKGGLSIQMLLPSFTVTCNKCGSTRAELRHFHDEESIFSDIVCADCGNSGTIMED